MSEMILAEVLLIALVSPLILSVLGGLIRNWLIEELIKLVLILRLAKSQMKSRTFYILCALVGVVFGLSETVLYGMNAFNVWSFGFMNARLLLTVPMHGVTAVLWGMGVKQKGVRRLAFAMLAVAVHYGLNLISLA